MSSCTKNIQDSFSEDNFEVNSMIVLFDIGGTKTRIAVTTDFKKFGTPAVFETPKRFGDALAMYASHLRELAKNTPISGAIIGIRGPLSPDKSTIVSETILTDWVERLIKKELSELCGGVPVYLENDTALVGLGEAHFGAGQGFNIMAYHTVSTGVGGVRIVNGEIDQAHTGFEPGKQIIDIDATVGKYGETTLEELISGAAIEKRFGRKPFEISQGDPVWDELARHFAIGLKNTILYWSPDVIVLGGSMVVGVPRILLSDIDRHVRELMAGFPALPLLKDATLKNLGGLYGALVLARKHFGADFLETTL
jgi:predicted NBD/HSP70 family sugar kinase